MNVTRLAMGLMLAVACIVLKTFLDYGVTWDEEFHRIYGEAIASWFLTFFHDRAAVLDPFFISYGGLFDFFAEIVRHVSPLGLYETRHLLGSLLGLWTIFISWKTARHISGDVAGLFTILLLSAHPVFYGHMFANPVDIPFGAFFMTAIYYFTHLYDHLPRPPRTLLIKLGVAVGLALSIRPSGMFILFLVFLFCYALKTYVQNKTKSFTRGRRTAKVQKSMSEWRIDRSFLWIPAAAWPIMILCWPYAQLNPVSHPFLAVLNSANWGWKRLVFFEASWYLPTQLPKTFLFKSILISLPEFFIAALVFGVISWVVFLIRKSDWNEELINRYAKIALVFFPVIISFLVNIFIQKTQFDGFRHFLFLIPLLAILGGISLDIFLKSILWKWVKVIVGFGLCFSFSLTVWDMIRLHPYQVVYFNRIFAGGLQGAVLKYETDYWGSSYKEGIEWVIKNYHSDLQRKVRIRNSSGLFQIGYYIKKDPQARERFQMVERDPDIYLSTTRWGYHQSYPGKILHVVERDGVPLLFVVEVRRK